MLQNHFSVDLLTFTEQILNGKLHFLCSVFKKFDVSVFQFYMLIYLPFLKIYLKQLKLQIVS